MNEDTEKIRVLMVDDEEEFLAASSRALARRGFHVDVAVTGAAALHMVGEQQFDVMVLDVKMPQIGGIEVFRRIRKTLPDLPVILLTGHGSIDDAFQTSKEGVAEYLSKPIDMDELAERLREVVRRPRKREETDRERGERTDYRGPVRVMLIDDEVAFLGPMKRVLERRNMDVMTAGSAEEGLALLKEKPVDVVVLDVRMPGMDGLEALSHIKKSFPGVDVILLSGHPSVEAAVAGIKLGANEYLKKPPGIEELVGAIRRLQENREKAVIEQQQELIEEIRRRYPD